MGGAASRGVGATDIRPVHPSWGGRRPDPCLLRPRLAGASLGVSGDAAPIRAESHVLYRTGFPGPFPSSPSFPAGSGCCTLSRHPPPPPPPPPPPHARGGDHALVQPEVASILLHLPNAKTLWNALLLPCLAAPVSLHLPCPFLFHAEFDLICHVELYLHLQLA